MKKFLLSTSLSCLALLTASLSSCAPSEEPVSVGVSADVFEDRISDYESTIASLETQIYELKQNQYLYGAESDKKIQELTALLQELKDKSENGESGESDAGNTDTSVGFKYIVSGSAASITGYEGNEKNIVIPSSVDGYRVTSIADGAFENTELLSVIICDGVETIGWFAFNGCASLKSVTIPTSVTSIGYSAFGTPDSSLTVYCHSDSFALSYVKSYGLAYTVI